MKTLILLSLFFSYSVLACLHYPIEYKDTISENKQEYFLFKKEGLLHLVAKTNLSSEVPLPDRLAWIFPLPSVPVSYEEVSPKIFNELYDLTKVYAKSLRGAQGLSDEALETNSMIKVHEAKVVGRYKVRPLEILDANPKTASVLDTWLTTNGLKPMPRDKQVAYLRKGAVFLVIEADLKGLKTADFKPLDIVIKNESASYVLPVNFTHEGREFDVDVYAFGLDLQPSTNKEKQSLFLVNSAAIKVSQQNNSELFKVLGPAEGKLEKFSGHYPGHGGMFPDPVFFTVERKVQTR